MAIYRLEAKIIGRRAKDKAGMPVKGKQVSVVAKAAYRAGEKLKDDHTHKTYNYVSRTSEVVHKEVVAPEASPDWLKMEQASGLKGRELRQRLWNEIERAEKRVDSQLAREFVVSLPKELNKQQRIELVRHWCRDEFVSKGFVADFAVHRSRDSKNPHAHILCTLRPVTPDGFGKKPNTAGKFNGRGWAGVGAKSDLEGWRDSWEHAVNHALEAAGRKERVDHRSLKDRGIDRDPEPKIGVDAVAMQRKGVETDPENVKSVRRLRIKNMILPYIRDIQKFGEIQEAGERQNWWSRTHSAARQMGQKFYEMMRSQSTSGAKWHEHAKKREQKKEVTKEVTHTPGR